MVKKWDLGGLKVNFHLNTHQQHLTVLFNLALPFISGGKAQNRTCDEPRGVLLTSLNKYSKTDGSVEREKSLNSHWRDCRDDVDARSQLLFHNTPVRQKHRLLTDRSETHLSYFQQSFTLHRPLQGVPHLASSLATVSFGQVTKAAECVPDAYVSDAMENVLRPTVLSRWNINTLSSTVWEEEEEEDQHYGHNLFHAR